MRRLLPLLLLAGCAPYTVLRQAEPNPFAGESKFAILPVQWSEVMVDGDLEDVWLKQNDAQTQHEWPGDKANASALITRAFTEATLQRVQLEPAPAPPSMSFSVKLSVYEVKTGGLKPLELTVRVQLLDGAGNVVDEARTTRKGHGLRPMQIMLAESAVLAGDALGQYLLSRVKK